MELTSNSLTALVVSLIVGISVAVPLVFEEESHEPSVGQQAGQSSDLGVRVTIQHVEELGCLDGPSWPWCFGYPDFYAVVTIDGTEYDNKASNGPWEDEDEIWPDWKFTEWVDASPDSIPVIIEIWDEDGFLRGDDDKADINPKGYKHLVLTLTMDSCTVSGDASGSCGATITSAGDDDDDEDVRVWFKIELVEPPRVRCIHSPIWPLPYNSITITAEALDATLSPRAVDMIEIYVNDKDDPVYWGSGAVLAHTVGPFADDTFFYGCRVVDNGAAAFTGWRNVSIGYPAGSQAVPILYTGPRLSTIDIVFIADRDDYSSAFDSDFLGDVASIILDAYYSEDVFLRNQHNLSFWIAMDTGDAEENCNYEYPANWDVDYTFADGGAIVHEGVFDHECGYMIDQIFGAPTGDLRILLHETGHVPFGLADEYCCDGGYFQADPCPNIYDNLADCEADAPNLGRLPDKCRKFVDANPFDPLLGGDWYTSEPDDDDYRFFQDDDLMNDAGPPRAADIRRIEWTFSECNSARCEDLTRSTFQTSIPPSVADLPAGSDPALEPIPVLDFDDPAKSIVVRLDFNNRTDVDFDSALVSLERGHILITNPPLLRVQLFDDTGAFVGGANAWHPLWASVQHSNGTGSRIILPRASGRFVIPFQDDLEMMKVIDIPLNQELIEVDLRPVIRDFCWQNPRDPDCMANFTWSAQVPEEGQVMQFADLSLGPDGNILSWSWDFGDGSPVSTLQNPTHIYGDNGIFRVKLTVTDRTGLTDSVKYDVIIKNVAPVIDSDVSAYAIADVTLRVAGEKWHDVTLTLMDGLLPVNSVSVTRFPGSPNNQAVTLTSQSLHLIGGLTSAIVEYTPENDPVNGQTFGANPVWVVLTLENGAEFRLKHTFNVRHSGTYLWKIENLLDHTNLVDAPIHFLVSATDPGSDDLTFTWAWDDGTPDSATTSLNNPILGPDPFPSPEVNPRNVTDCQVHAFSVPRTYVIVLTVMDDDSGSSVATLSITIYHR